jgi:hypothetical protein
MGQGLVYHAMEGFSMTATPSGVRPGRTLEGCGSPAEGDETLILGFTRRDKSYLVYRFE